MRAGQKASLAAGLFVFFVVVTWKPLVGAFILSSAGDNEKAAAKQVDGHIAEYAQRVIHLSNSPQGPTEDQLDRLDWQDWQDWDHVRAGDAGTLRSLTVLVSEPYSTAFGVARYQECRRITFHDLGTPAAGYKADEKVGCSEAFGPDLNSSEGFDPRPSGSA